MQKITFLADHEFPREVGLWRDVVYNRQQFLDYINKYSGYKNIYTSLYYFTRIVDGVNGRQHEPEYSSAVVDKIWYDLDDENAVENVLKLEDYFAKQNIAHLITFTGNGYHFFIFIVSNLTNPEVAVEGALNYITDKLRLKINKDHRKMFKGILRRAVRIPFTFNYSAKRWCLPIKSDDIKKAKEISLQFRQSPSITECINGEGLLDIKKFDSARTVPETFIEAPVPDGSIIKYLNINNFPSCIRKLIERKRVFYKKGPNTNKDERLILILFCKEILGLSEEEAAYNIKSWLTRDEWRHMMREVSNRRFGQISYIYNREDLFFPNINTLLEYGVCIEFCSKCVFK